MGEHAGKPDWLTDLRWGPRSQSMSLDSVPWEKKKKGSNPDLPCEDRTWSTGDTGPFSSHLDLWNRMKALPAPGWPSTSRKRSHYFTGIGEYGTDSSCPQAKVQKWPLLLLGRASSEKQGNLISVSDNSCSFLHCFCIH